MGALTSALAQAQTPADDRPSNAQIEDIVVTAQRRAENLQSVPIAVSAFTAQKLEAAGVLTSQDISQVTPGFQVGNQLNATILNIRGVGSQTGSPGDEASVSTYVDGFYMTDARATIFELNNIERVEVLKGPQGTLFGRNAVGGLVQVITKDPSETTALKVEGGYGNYRTTSGNIYATTAVAHGIAVDISATGRYQDKGYGHNLTTGTDVLKTKSYAARSKLLITAIDGVRQTFGFDIGRYVTSMGVGRAIAPGAVGVGGSTRPANSGFYDITSNFEPLGNTRQWGVNSKTEIETGSFFNIVNLAQYRKSTDHEFVDQDTTPLPVVNATQNSYSRYWTEEFQIVSNENSPFKWIVGAFYFHSNAGFDPLTVAGSTNLFANVSTRSYAVYGQATYNLGWNTNLTGGIRYSHDRRALTGTRFSAITGLPNLTVPATVKTPASFSKATWHLSLDHKFDDNIMAYASYSRGFKSGVYAISTITNPLVNPEQLDAYEVGLKSDLFDRSVRLNLAAFHYNWKNIQLTQTVAFGSILFNAARATVNGAEAEIELRPIENLSLTGNVSYIDAKYKNFPNGPCFRGPRPTGGDIPEPLPPAGRANGVAGSCDLSGNKLLRTPPVTFTIGFDYRIPSSVGDFRLAATYYYNDGFFWESENRLRQNHYGLLSGQVSWQPDDRWTVRVWGKNLTQAKYNAYSTSNATFGDSVSPASPRTFGFTVGVKLM
jgi:iron complex outermembrane receptor protein